MADGKASENVDDYNKLVDEYNAIMEKIDKTEDEAIAAQKAYADKVGMRVK